jgi:hypothetical protein
MAKCINGHDQPEHARFCGLCGAQIAIPSDLSSESEDAEDAEAETAPTTQIDLDLLEDDDLVDEDEGLNDESDEEDGELENSNDQEDVDEEDEDEDKDGDLDDSDDEADAEDGDEPDAELADDEFDDEEVEFLFGRSVSQGVTGSLRQWAATHSQLNDPYVAGLLGAIDRRDDLTSWASLSPLELLPHPKTSSGVLVGRIASIALFLRNVLIFVPVLLTWLSIGRAVAAYQTYSQSVTPEDQQYNFLQFWEDPEDYLSKFWTIGDVSRHVAILIFSIIVLTFIGGLLNAKARSVKEAAEAALDVERLRIALELSHALHGKRQANPESIGEALAEALNDLTQAARDVNEAAARLEETSGGVSALNPHVEALNRNAQVFFDDTGKQVIGSIRELVASVENLNQSVSGNVTALFTEAALTIEEVSKQLAKTNASVEYGTKQLRDDLEALHAQLQSLTRGTR